MKLLQILKNPPGEETQIQRTDMENPFILTIHETTDPDESNWFEWGFDVRLFELSDFTTDKWEIIG